jgi:hypothetical protein
LQREYCHQRIPHLQYEGSTSGTLLTGVITCIL